MNMYGDKMTDLILPLRLCLLFHLQVLLSPLAPFHPEMFKQRSAVRVLGRCIKLKHLALA